MKIDFIGEVRNEKYEGLSWGVEAVFEESNDLIFRDVHSGWLYWVRQ